MSKTNRRDESRRIRARGVRRNEPDLRKLARAFINMAIAQAEADAQADDEARKLEPTDEVASISSEDVEETS